MSTLPELFDLLQAESGCDCPVCLITSLAPSERALLFALATQTPSASDHGWSYRSVPDDAAASALIAAGLVWIDSPGCYALTAYGARIALAGLVAASLAVLISGGTGQQEFFDA